MRKTYAVMLALAIVATPAVSRDQAGKGADFSADAKYHDLTRAIDILQGRMLQDDGAQDNAAIAAASWLAGVYEVLSLNAYDPGSTMKICTPAGLRAETMAHVYISYMDTHPESHKLNSLAVAILSSRSAYPCKP